MKITYYLEILSSWCYWVEPTWVQLKERYKGRAQFEWRIASMNPADYPVSQSQVEWFYRRSGGTVMRSPVMLNSGWFDKARKGVYDNPNLVAEAGRDFGVSDDRIRLALSHAGLIEGRKVGDLDIAVAIAAKAGRIHAKKLKARAQSSTVRNRIEASTEYFLSHRINQRPAFILEDSIGDKTVFSGIVKLEPIAATIDAMLADTAAYAAHSAHYGQVPSC